MHAKTALITGASAGLGRVTAAALSKLGYQLILIARREQNLIELAEQLEAATYLITCDVTDYGALSNKLRTRFGFTGQIRAIGDVKFDQLGFLTRTGCNAFELPEGENIETALQAFCEMSDVYQPAADSGRLIFSRRRTTH